VQAQIAGGDGWTSLTNTTVPAGGYAWHLLNRPDALWIRLIPDVAAANITAWFHLANPPRSLSADLFAGIADAGAGARSEGIIRPRSGDAQTLQFAATIGDEQGEPQRAYYEIDGAFRLRRATNNSAENTLRTTYGLTSAAFTVDAASVVVTEKGKRFRLPKSHASFDSPGLAGWPRGKREVVTERNLFQAHGTFYELPREDAGGFRRVRPIATHNKAISDYASWRGLFVIAGVAADAQTNSHIFRSDEGKAALWFGNVDDLWRMGPPAGTGGPWKNTAVSPNVPSDPYLMFGYEHKTLHLSHESPQPVTFRIEVDVAADDTWNEYARFTVRPGEKLEHVFPGGYTAHWVRVQTEAAATATAVFTYAASSAR